MFAVLCTMPGGVAGERETALQLRVYGDLQRKERAWMQNILHPKLTAEIIRWGERS